MASLAITDSVAKLIMRAGNLSMGEAAPYLSADSKAWKYTHTKESTGSVLSIEHDGHSGVYIKKYSLGMASHDAIEWARYKINNEGNWIVESSWGGSNTSNWAEKECEKIVAEGEEKGGKEEFFVDRN